MTIAKKTQQARTRQLIAFVIMLAALLTACGGGDSTADSAAGETGTPDDSEDTSAEPADGGETVQLAFIGESSSTDVIWNFGAEVMRDEAEALGAEFVDRYADGDFARQAEMIEQEIARGVDGIIAPFFDPETANAAIRRALDEGIAIYAIMGIPALEDEELEQIGYADTSWYEVGRSLGEITLEDVGDGANILWPAEVPEGTYITDAVRGFEDVADERGITVNIEVLDAGSDPSQSSSRQLSYVTGNADTDAVVTSGAIAIGAANTAMTQGNLSPGQPPLFGQVVNPSSIRGIRDGYMPAGIWIAMEEAATAGIQNLVGMIRDDAPGEHSTVPITVVTQENIDEVVPAELAE